MKFKNDKIYYIECLDHMILAKKGEEITLKFFGLLEEQDDNYLEFIIVKVHSKLDDSELEEENHDRMKVMRSTITKKRIINV